VDGILNEEPCLLATIHRVVEKLSDMWHYTGSQCCLCTALWL